MKPNKKIIDLIENGFSYKTISKFSPKQLDEIHSRIIKEQGIQTTEKKMKVTKIPAAIAKSSGAKLGDKTIVSTNTTGDVSISQEMSENKKSKKSKSKNPWAICTSSLSDEFGTSERSEWTKSQLKKYERCVMGVKEKMDEGKNPFEVVLENKITQLIEKHVHPKMTKKDFLEVLTKKMIQESKTKEKEKEKEKTKPTTKPVHPLSPKPGPNPRPKAKKSEMDEGDTKTKPTTKPGTKPTTKPGHPFSPKPGPNPAPKAKKGNIPDWFTFDKLGLKIK